MKTDAPTVAEIPAPPFPQSGCLRWLSARLAAVPEWVAVLLALSLALFIGWVDDLTGWEMSLFIFYALPIIIAVWRCGISAGLFTAAFCGVVWLFANQSSHPYETHLGYACLLYTSPSPRDRG